MATFGLCEVSAESPSHEIPNRNQMLFQQSIVHGRAIGNGRTSHAQRVLRVLVVDGGRESGNELGKVARRQGHVVRHADDGLAALRAAAGLHPDIVLLNLDLPLMDGCQIARHLRRDFPSRDCLVIALTAKSNDGHRQQCIKAGIDLLLVAPVVPEIFETLLMLECGLVNRLQVA